MEYLLYRVRKKNSPPGHVDPSQPGLIDSIHYTDHNRFIRHETRTIMNRKQRYWNDQWIKRAEIQKHCSSFRKLVRLPYRFFWSIQHIPTSSFTRDIVHCHWRWLDVDKACTALNCTVYCACVHAYGIGALRCICCACVVWCRAVRWLDHCNTRAARPVHAPRVRLAGRALSCIAYSPPRVIRQRKHRTVRILFGKLVTVVVIVCCLRA